MGLKQFINRILGVADNSAEINVTPKNERFINFSDDMLRIVHVNPNVYLASRGARICVGRLPAEGNTEREEYIEKVARRGHESVMEHTNSVVILLIPKVNTELYPVDFASFLSCTKYCNVSSSDYRDYIALLIGGSVRAWLHLLREINATNVFLPWIEEAMYHTYEKCFLISAIESGYLDKDKCNYAGLADIKMVKSDITQVKNVRESTNSDDNYAAESVLCDPMEKDGERVSLIYKSPCNEILNDVKKYGFKLYDVYNVCTITFRFHDISRTCSHQLVRHRNGISQESQRYVSHDYNKAVDFVDPIVMNYEERYKNNTYFGYIREKIKENDPFLMYKYLISNKVVKEDARAWLPSNVTTQLLVTMTYSNWAKFLKLRMHPSAQKEIRLAAFESAGLVCDDASRDMFVDYTCSHTGRYYSEQPVEDKLLSEVDADKVDEVITTNPEPININSLEDAAKMIKQNEDLK